VRHLDDAAPTQLPSGKDGAPGREPEVIDPELVAIAAPPQAQRVAALTIMAAAVVAAMALLLSLRSDIGYALSTGQPADLGHVRELVPSSVESNSFVRLAGTPTIGRSVGFARGFGTRYRVFPLAGQRTVYVQVRDSGGESFVRAAYSGRLVTFDDLGGRYAELARVMHRDAGLPVSSESFVLLADEPPSAYTWTLFIALICAAFVLLDVYFIVRWFRPVKWAAIPAT
jgi:hypothetical protein